MTFVFRVSKKQYDKIPSVDQSEPLGMKFSTTKWGSLRPAGFHIWQNKRIKYYKIIHIFDSEDR